MTKLTYTSAAALVAAFQAGKKFEIQGYIRDNGPVLQMYEASLTPNGVAVITDKLRLVFHTDGTHAYGSAARLVETTPAAPSFPYESAEALVADFKAGAKFEVKAGTSDGEWTGPVIDIQDSFSGGFVRVLVPTSISGNDYRLDGRGSCGRILVKVADAPVASVPVQAAQMSPDQQPFLKRFVLGEPAYCPKTREVVTEVAFTNGEINVELRNEDGLHRYSTSYNHEGKHKSDPARTLVLGELPPKPVKAPEVKEYTLAELETTAPAGVYSVRGLYEVVVFRHGSGAVKNVVMFRAYRAGGNALEPLCRANWEDDTFVLTNKKFSATVR